MIFAGEQQGWLIGDCISAVDSCWQGVYRTEDGGVSWRRTEMEDVKFLRGLAFRDSMSGWAIATPDCESYCPYALLRTSDGGERWSSIGEIDTGIGPYVSSLHAIKDAVLVVGIGIALRSTDGGVTFESMTHPAVALGEVEFVDEGTGYSMSNGILVRTDDAGQNWREMATPGFGAAFHFFDQQRGFAVARVAASQSIEISETHDGGKSWRVLGSVLDAGRRGVA